MSKEDWLSTSRKMSFSEKLNNCRSKERKLCPSLPSELPRGVRNFDLTYMEHATKTLCILWM